MTQQVTTDSIQVVTFSLINGVSKKKEDYAIPIEQVREIRTLEEITKIPKAKSYVRGIMNLRGLIIPVIDVNDTSNRKFDSYNYVKGIAKTKDKLLVLIDVVPLIQDAADVPIPNDTSEVEAPRESIPKPEINHQNESTDTPQDDMDDLPDELKSVFEEDANGTPPAEIIRQEEADTTADFQTRVNQESEKIYSGTLRS